MQYVIEVNDKLNDILINNASAHGASVSELIADLLNRYVIDAHIMNRELWKDGIDACADINLDWANL